MPSLSLEAWGRPRAAALAEIESAHRSIGGTGRGRRFATQQINQAYAVILTSQFQGYCRDLHSECADCFVGGIAPVVLRTSCRNALVQDRKLDRGNPNSGNLGSDFKRFGFVFWDAVGTLYNRKQLWQYHLDELNKWRNAIVHQDFDPAKSVAPPLRLDLVRRWRRSCDHLATAFDRVMSNYLHSTLGHPPW